MSRVLYVLFMILGGAALAVQSPVNSGLGRRIGVFEGGLWSFTTGMLLLVLLVILFGHGHLTQIPSVPKWQLIGGVLGVVGVVSMIVCAPELGVGLAVVCLLFGQIAVAVAIDTWGLFGVEPVPLDFGRIIGIVLILIGVILVYRSKF